MPRGITVTTTIIAAVLIRFIFIRLYNKMISGVMDFYGFPIPETITGIINDAVLRFEVFNESLPEDVKTSITSNNTILSSLRQWLQNLSELVLKDFAKLPTFLVVVVITIVSTYFFKG